jgi:hypothetical protein
MLIIGNPGPKRCKSPKIFDPLSERCVQPMWKNPLTKSERGEIMSSSTQAQLAAESHTKEKRFGFGAYEAGRANALYGVAHRYGNPGQGHICDDSCRSYGCKQASAFRPTKPRASKSERHSCDDYCRSYGCKQASAFRPGNPSLEPDALFATADSLRRAARRELDPEKRLTLSEQADAANREAIEMQQSRTPRRRRIHNPLDVNERVKLYDAAKRLHRNAEEAAKMRKRDGWDGLERIMGEMAGLHRAAELTGDKQLTLEIGFLQNDLHEIGAQAGFWLTYSHGERFLPKDVLPPTSPKKGGFRKLNPTDPTGKDFSAGFIFWEGEGDDAQNEAYNALRILKQNSIPADLEVVPGDPRKFGTWRYRIHVAPPADPTMRMIYDGVLNRIASETMQGKMTGVWPSLTRPSRGWKRKSPPREKTLEGKYPILGKLARERKERGGNPPRFIVIDAQTGVVQYTKTATKTGDEALRKAHLRAQDMANKLGRTFLVFLDLHNAKVGAQVSVEMVVALGATEVHPGAGRGENPSHGIPAHIANDPAFKKEMKAYRRRHGSGPVEIRTVQVPKGYPKFMSVYGEAPHAVYDAPSNSIKGKRIHHFGKKGTGKPWLVSSASRGPKFLAYVGGKFRAGTDWLYD